MEWTEETIARLRELWEQGLSTAEIGRTLGFTKNAVVGKAHRLQLPARPSPIRQKKAAGSESTGTAEVQPAATPAVEEKKDVQVAAVAETPAAVTPEAKAVEAAPKIVVPPAAPVVDTAASVVKETPASPAVAAAEAKPAEAAPKAKPAARASTRSALRSVSIDPEPKRRGPSCCWPLGDPGTPGFHFCGATPLPGKPYCAEHAQIAYVKLRDRRDSVA